MAYQFAQITATVAYKGHRIDTVESPMQIVYMIDGNESACYWSMADARRAVNSKPTVYCPVDVRNWFKNV